jgi:UDP-glucose 4-epimerase
MDILVTGGSGFIGSNLVDELVKENKVTVWDNYDTGGHMNPKANHIFQDILKPYKSPKNIDVIFHIAAKARIQPSFEKPFITHETNVAGTVRMLELARQHNAKFVYAGSSSAYFDVHANPYAFSKWQGEQYCELYNKVYGVKVAIARFFNVYGPREYKEGTWAPVVGRFIHQWENNKPLTITGDGEQRRDFTHVFDIVSGLIAMSKGEWNADIFNLGTGKNHSINELAELFETNIEYTPKRPGEANTTMADISKSKELLDWNPVMDLERYINEIKL